MSAGDCWACVEACCHCQLVQRQVFGAGADVEVQEVQDAGSSGVDESQ